MKELGLLPPGGPQLSHWQPYTFFSRPANYIQKTLASVKKKKRDKKKIFWKKLLIHDFILKDDNREKYKEGVERFRKVWQRCNLSVFFSQTVFVNIFSKKEEEFGRQIRVTE